MLGIAGLLGSLGSFFGLGLAGVSLATTVARGEANKSAVESMAAGAQTAKVASLTSKEKEALNQRALIYSAALGQFLTKGLFGKMGIETQQQLARANTSLINSTTTS